MCIIALCSLFVFVYVGLGGRYGIAYVGLCYCWQFRLLACCFTDFGWLIVLAH